jgi:hypothetical protein
MVGVQAATDPNRQREPIRPTYINRQNEKLEHLGLSHEEVAG